MCETCRCARYEHSVNDDILFISYNIGQTLNFGWKQKLFWRQNTLLAWRQPRREDSIEFWLESKNHWTDVKFSLELKIVLTSKPNFDLTSTYSSRQTLNFVGNENCFDVKMHRWLDVNLEQWTDIEFRLGTKIWVHVSTQKNRLTLKANIDLMSKESECSFFDLKPTKILTSYDVSGHWTSKRHAKRANALYISTPRMLIYYLLGRNRSTKSKH